MEDPSAMPAALWEKMGCQQCQRVGYVDVVNEHVTSPSGYGEFE
jgi:hypothetical protein